VIFPKEKAVNKSSDHTQTMQKKVLIVFCISQEILVLDTDKMLSAAHFNKQTLYG